MEEFHRTINYRAEWGFPWENYQPLFDWAREMGVRLIALNRPKELVRTSASFRRIRSMADLYERDRWAAGLITDLLGEDRKRGIASRMLVLYGELHVSRNHLPKHLTVVSRGHLERPLRSLSIHQNSDQVYWSLARKKHAVRADAIQLDRDSYCVISSTPWAKLQSLIGWLEGDLFNPVSEDPQVESDYLSAMQTYGRAIAKTHDLTPAPFDNITLQIIHDADFIDWLENEPYFSRREFRLLESLILANQRIYIPRSDIAYIGTPSHNGAAQLASSHLLRHHTGDERVFEATAEDFFRLVLEAAFAFFGSLLLNPRRKCDLEHDHQVRLTALRKSRSRSEMIEAQARQLALRVLQASKRNRVFGQRAAPKLSAMPSLREVASNLSKAPVAFLAAKYLGKILGKKLHLAFIASDLSAEEIRKYFFEPPKRASFEQRYLDMARSLARVRLERSKRSRI